MLILMTGLPGTGKSTVARALARELGAAVLSTDRIRAEKPRSRRFTTMERGGVYERMFARAAVCLNGGRPVILDGTFYLERLRRAGAALGRRAGVPVFVVEVTAPLAIVKRRMDRRLRTALGPVPADFRVHYFIRRSFEPVQGRHFIIDTAAPSEWKRDVASIAKAMRVLEGKRRMIAPLSAARKRKSLRAARSYLGLAAAHARRF